MAQYEKKRKYVDMKDLNDRIDEDTTGTLINNTTKPLTNGDPEHPLKRQRLVKNRVVYSHFQELPKELDHHATSITSRTSDIEAEERSEGNDETENAEFIPSTPCDTESGSRTTSPKRLLTPTGDSIHLCLALHRSRRDAALEEMRRRYCPILRAPHATLHDSQVDSSSPSPYNNIGPSASQESYEGDWVDEIASEFLNPK